MSAQLGNFQDPYDFQSFGGTYGVETFDTKAQADSAYGKSYVSSGNSIWEKISDWLGFSDSKARYNEWLTQRDREYERAAVNSARAWDEYMDSTKYQRAFADLKAAGVNPYLALSSGASAGGTPSTASTGGSARSKSADKSGKSNSLAMLLFAAAKLIAAL